MTHVKAMTPSTLTSQHWAVSRPDEQRGARSWRGDAAAMPAKRATMTVENCILLDGEVDEMVCVVV